MKNILSSFFMLCTLLTEYSNAQIPEPARAQATYHFTYVRDTTDRAHPYNEDLQLLLGRYSSACTSIDARLQDQNFVKELQNQVKNAADPNHINLNISAKRQVSDEYFQFFATHQLFTKKNLVNDYLVEEPLPIINWKISSDTSTINGLHCQKANAVFKGRSYEAWFCAALPFHAGPWKLQGLPGLIIAASDVKKEVQFQFTGFKQLDDLKLMVKLPEDAIRATLKEYARLQEVRKTNPQALSKMAGKSPKSPLDDIDGSKISSMNITPSTENFSKKINNPIELIER